jgi:phosphoglycolate phosphatase
MPYSLVIFDLDGTLVDSFPWFLRNVNDVADRFGFRKVAEHEIEDLRHKPAREILRLLGIPLWKLPRIARHMQRMMAEDAVSAPLFDGAAEVLRALASAGHRLALVTSNSEANAREKLGDSATLFAHFACGTSIFGKAAKFRRVLKQARVAASETLAIGDETRDIEAARAAGIACGAVTWGYAAPSALKAFGPDLVFEQMDDIARALIPDNGKDLTQQ